MLYFGVKLHLCGSSLEFGFSVGAVAPFVLHLLLLDLLDLFLGVPVVVLHLLNEV